jgi:hypothetical protein
MQCGNRSLASDVAFFVALMAAAMALGGALAHALELPNKIDLSVDEYFIVQQFRGRRGHSGHAAPGLHLSPLSDRAAQHGLGGSRIGAGRLPYEDS